MIGIATSNLAVIKKRVAEGEPFGKCWDNCQMATKTKAEQTQFNQQAFTQYTAGFCWFLHLPKPRDKEYFRAYEALVHGGGMGLPLSAIYQEPDYDQVNALELLDLASMNEYFPLRAYQGIEWVLRKHFPMEMDQARGEKYLRVQKPDLYKYEGIYRIDPKHSCEFFALPTLELNETTTSGTSEIIREYNKFLGIDLSKGDMHEQGEVDVGDHLTAMRISILARQRMRDFPHEQMKHVFRIPGILHVDMAIVDMILRAHWGNPNGLDPGSLSHFVGVLGRTKIGEKKAQYDATQSLEGVVWEAMVLAGAAKELEAGSYGELGSKLGEVNWADTIVKMVDTYFPLRKIWYMRRDAEEKARAQWEDVLRVPVSRRTGDQLLDKERYVKKLSTAGRDIGYENFCLYLQHGLIEWMFHEDTKVGDTGAILKNMEILAITMNGCSKSNYGNAMLELLLDRKTWWTPGMEYVWLNNALVNLAGRERKFMGVDQVNELLVQKIKDTHNPRGTPQSKKFHLEAVSMNAFTFRRIQRSVMESSGAPNYGGKHSKVSDVKDVETVMESVMREQLAVRKDGCMTGSRAEAAPIVESLDLITRGRNVISQGKLNALIEDRITRARDSGGTAAGLGMDDSDAENSEEGDVLLDEISAAIRGAREEEAEGDNSDSESWNGRLEWDANTQVDNDYDLDMWDGEFDGGGGQGGTSIAY